MKLNFILYLIKQVRHGCFPNSLLGGRIGYRSNTPMSLAIVITIVVIIYGIVQLVNFDRIKKYFKY